MLSGPWCGRISPCISHPGVFRDGELDSLADHKQSTEESQNFRNWGAAQLQEFGGPVN